MEKKQFIHGKPANLPYYAKVSAAAGATTQLVAASTGKKIRILGYQLTGETANGTIILKSATTAISGTMTLADNGNLTVPFSPVGWVETASGEALNITTVGCAVEGFLVYTLA